MEPIRSFIAIELPDELKLALTRLQTSLKQVAPPVVKWVEARGIHLTLKFLGNVSSDRINDIIQVMEQSARGIPPFQLEAKNVGAFPNLKRPQVLWVGVSGQLDRLSQLQQRIETNLVPLDFAAEQRPFTAHLTLARIREQASSHERQRLGEFVVAAKFDTAYTIAVNSVSLMRSELTREGAIYSRIGSVQLRLK